MDGTHKGQSPRGVKRMLKEAREHVVYNANASAFLNMLKNDQTEALKQNQVTKSSLSVWEALSREAESLKGEDVR